MQLTFQNREFELWEYLNMHSQLLIRSPMSRIYSDNIDIVFSGVSYVNIPKRFQVFGIKITKGGVVNDLKLDITNEENIYQVETNKGNFYVIALGVNIKKNILSLSDSGFGTLMDSYFMDTRLSSWLALLRLWNEKFPLSMTYENDESSSFDEEIVVNILKGKIKNKSVLKINIGNIFVNIEIYYQKIIMSYDFPNNAEKDLGLFVSDIGAALERNIFWKPLSSGAKIFVEVLP